MADPRTTPARPDLAAAYLKGRAEAARFAEGETRAVIETSAPVRRAPRHDAPLDTEALYGERVTVYDVDAEGWAWGQLETDGYVGYMPANALIAPSEAPTHRVIAPRTFLFPAADIKVPPLAALSFGSLVTVRREEGGFALTPRGAIYAKHLAKRSEPEPDFVESAGKFLGTPYLWGGRTSLGLDCSALVQLALFSVGIGCPRDSDMQEQSLGAPVALKDLRRGDLLFWKGHVAIACDAKTIIHANAFHMAVAVEPLAGALARIEAAGSKLTSVKRIESVIA